MKRSVLLLILLIVITSCKESNSVRVTNQKSDELVGSWVGTGTHYAGSKIIGSTTFIFNNDKTFVAVDQAKGMPELREPGNWFVQGDTLKLKFKKHNSFRPNIIAYHERNGGPDDIIRPLSSDTSGYLALNYRINRNKLQLDYSPYQGPNVFEMTKE